MPIASVCRCAEHPLPHVHISGAFPPHIHSSSPGPDSPGPPVTVKDGRTGVSGVIPGGRGENAAVGQGPASREAASPPDTPDLPAVHVLGPDGLDGEIVYLSMEGRGGFLSPAMRVRYRLLPHTCPSDEELTEALLHSANQELEG